MCGELYKNPAGNTPSPSCHKAWTRNPEFQLRLRTITQCLSSCSFKYQPLQYLGQWLTYSSPSTIKPDTHWLLKPTNVPTSEKHKWNVKFPNNLWRYWAPILFVSPCEICFYWAMLFPEKQNQGFCLQVCFFLRCLEIIFCDFGGAEPRKKCRVAQGPASRSRGKTGWTLMSFGLWQGQQILLMDIRPPVLW